MGAIDAILVAVALALVETALVVGVVGPSASEVPYGIGTRELLLNLILLVMILGVARLRPRNFYLLDRQSL